MWCCVVSLSSCLIQGESKRPRSRLSLAFLHANSLLVLCHLCCSLLAFNILFIHICTPLNCITLHFIREFKNGFAMDLCSASPGSHTTSVIFFLKILFNSYESYVPLQL